MSERDTRGAAILGWWQVNIGDRENGGARALAARLRRAGRIEALAEPEVHELARRLGLGPWPGDADRLVRLVQVLAEVRTHVGGRAGRLAARFGGPEPALSSLRFQRLMRAEGEDLTAALRRALPMADRTCNLADLGTDLLGWDHPEWGDEIRARWCFEYFGAQAPETHTPEGADPAETPEETRS